MSTPPAAPPRVLGFWSAVAIVMGNMIGSGVFLLPSSLAAYGGLSLAAWLVSAGGAVMLALVLARLARWLPAAGGLYAYTREAFGPALGFLVGWGYWLSSVATLAALAVAFVGYLDPFIPAIVRAPASAAMLAVAAIWVLVGVNVLGVRAAGRTQIVTVALKILPLALVGIGGLFFFEPSSFLLPDPGPDASLPGLLVAAVTLTLWAVLGLECATIPADNVTDPERTIPRATVVGTIATALIYIVATMGVMSLVPGATLETSTAPFADGARALLGPGAAQLVAVGAAVSCFGALNGWTLVTGQLPAAAAADGLFPAWFGRRSSRGVPVWSMAAAGMLASLLVALNYSRTLVELFTFIILLSTLSTLVPYVFCSLAVWLMPGRPRLQAGAATTSIAAFAYSMFAIYGAGAETVFYGFLLILGGLPIYAAMARTRPAR
jgi:APA family basic amino acid/polyamine antiporter